MRHKLDTKGLPLKKKWENFWYYYKWHTIALIFVIILAGYTIRDAVTKVNYDFNIDIIGSAALPFESTDKISQALEKSGAVADNYSDGKINVLTGLISVPAKGETTDGTQEQVAQVKLAVGESVVIITDERYMKGFSDSGVYGDITSVADKAQIPQDRRYLSPDGKVMGVKLDGCKFFADMGLNTDGLYITKRIANKDAKKDEQKMKEYNNADSVIEYILGDTNDK